MPKSIVRFVDAHCHLADLKFEGRRDQILADAQKTGVTHFVQGGVDPQDWRRQHELSKKYGSVIIPSFGLHPWFVSQASEADCQTAFDTLTTLLGEQANSPASQGPPLGSQETDRVGSSAAIGELGLDHSKKFSNETRGHQLKWFEAQLAMPEAFERPLILHVVNAHELVAQTLKKFQGPRPFRGLVHGFAGTWEQATAYWDLGFHISLGGGIFRKPSEEFARVLSHYPLDRIVIESDSPDQPVPRYKSSLNQPDAIWDVAAYLGQLRGLTANDVLEVSRSNLIAIFNIQ